MPDAIKPDAIPGKDLNPDEIELQAGTIATIGTSVADNGYQVHQRWQGMAAVYEAPESGTLLGLMQPVSTDASATGDNLAIVASALSAFAEEVRPIKEALDALRLEAQEFVDTTVANGVDVQELNPAWVSMQSYGYGVGGGVPATYGYGTTGSSATAAEPEKYQTVHREWHEDQDAVDRNNDLIAQVNAQQVLLWEAERSCANKIRALYCAAPLHSGYESENDPLGYGVDEIPDGTDMPWGAEVERTEGCGEAAVNFVVKDFLWEGIVVNGLWGTVQGLGALTLGYNPNTGEWFSGDAYGAAWSGLGMLAASAVVAATPPLNLLFAADDAVQQFGGDSFLPDPIADFDDKMDESMLNMGKSLIAWDQWQDDPGTAAGTALFNVGTIFIPVAGEVAAGLKGASTAASVVSRVATVVDLVDPASLAFRGVSGVGRLGLGSIDNFLGRLDDLSRVDTPHFDAPHVETYTAADAASALDRIDQLGVNLDDVTTHVNADGSGVLSFPGGQVDVPRGGFEVPGGGVDAPAVVREPGLVLAGGGRADAGGPGVVNSIVDEAPVRTDTAGPGESATVRETETGESGSGTHGSGGAGSDSGGGAGAGDEGGSSSGPGGSGDGWTAGPDHRGGPINEHYGQPRADHGTLDDRFTPPAEIPAELRQLVTDPEAPYGRGADGEPYTRAEWEERYMGPDNRPIYPGNDGAVPGTRVSFADMTAFRAAYGDTVDRFGGSGGAYLSPEGVVFEHRALPGSNLNSGYHVFRLADELPEGVRIEVSEVAPAFGQPGGGIQLQFVHETDGVLSVEQLLSSDYRILEATSPAPHVDLDAGATSLSDLSSPVPGSADVTALHHGSIPADMQRALIRHEYPGMLGINATRFDGLVSGTIDPKLAKLGWDQNCTRCVIAFDNLMDGAHSSAMPSAVPRNVSDIFEALDITPNFQWAGGYDEVVGTMSAMPEGSRGVVYIGRDDGSAHVFNVIHDRNGVVFLDAQTGTFAQLEDVARIGLIVTKNG